VPVLREHSRLGPGRVDRDHGRDGADRSDGADGNPRTWPACGNGSR
jgi:hypothetical protein